MASFIQRWFTPSKSDGSGMVSPQPSRPSPAPKRPEPEISGVAKAKTVTRFGGGVGKRIEDEAKTAKKKLLGG